MTDYENQITRYKRLLKAIQFFQDKKNHIKQSWFRIFRKKELLTCLKNLRTLKKQEFRLRPRMQLLIIMHHELDNCIKNS